MKKKGVRALTSVININKICPKSKRSLSGVVTLVILVLLALIAIGIVSVVFFNIIQRSSSGINPDKFTISLSIVRESVKLEDDGSVTLKVKRNVGEGDLTSIEFIISNGTDSYSETIPVSMEELEEQTFNVNKNNNIQVVSENSTITIVPIIQNKQAKLDYGDRAEIYDFKTQTIKIISTSSPGFSRGSSGGDTNPPGATTCDLTSASWNTATATEGQQVTMNVQASNCAGVQLNYTIYEDDGLIGSDSIYSLISTSLNPTWNALYIPDTFPYLDIDPEYYFKAFVVNNISETITSSNQLSVSQQACVPTTEICNDGIDNDCDGTIDESDCSSLAPSNWIVENVTGNINTHRVFTQLSPYVPNGINFTVFVNNGEVPLLPAVGVPFIDSDSGHRITRITDVTTAGGYPTNPAGYNNKYFSGLHNGYSRWSNVNYNQKYIFAYGSTNLAMLYNLTSYEPMRLVTTKFGTTPTVGEQNGLRWDQRGIPGTETLFYYQVDSKLLRQDALVGENSEEVIYDFQPFSNYTGDYLNDNSDGEASADGRYFAVTLRKAERTIIYDLFINTTLQGMPYNPRGGPNIGDANGDVDISPDGKWMQITGTSAQAGWYSLDKLRFNDTSYIYLYANASWGAAGHSSWAYDQNGESVRVWTSGGDLRSLNLRTGELKTMISGLEQGNFNGIHVARISNPAKKGWALFGTYVDYTKNNMWTYNNLYMVELKDKSENPPPRIWRIGFKNLFWYYSGQTQYFAQAFASLDRQGNNIYYGTNWFGTDNLELYRVELPQNWEQVLAGTIPQACIQNWQCTSWSACLNNLQTRICTDLNNCNNATGKPIESQSCSVGTGAISFVSPPTPDNGATISGNSVEIKSIINTNIKNLNFNWNGVDYLLYDPSLVLMTNFDKVSILGETDSIVKDFSGKGNNATCTSCPAWNSNGKYNGAYIFDGVNDRLTITNNPSLVLSGGDFTISAWVNIANYPSSRAGIVSKRYSGNYPYEFTITSTGQFRLLVSGGGLSSASAIPKNVWKHITVVYKNGATTGFFIDGEPDGTYSSWSSTDYNTPIVIGSEQNAANSYPFNGSIDEVRIYKRALTDNEIKELYYSNLNKYDIDKWMFYVNQSVASSGTYNYRVSMTDTNDIAYQTEQRTVTVNAPARKVFELYQGVDIPEWGIYNYSYGADGFQANWWGGFIGGLGGTTKGKNLILNTVITNPNGWVSTGAMFYWNLSKVPSNLNIKRAYFGFSGTNDGVDLGNRPTGKEGYPIRRITNPMNHEKIWTMVYTINPLIHNNLKPIDREYNYNGASWYYWEQDPCYVQNGVAYTCDGSTSYLDLPTCDVNGENCELNGPAEGAWNVSRWSNLPSQATDPNSQINGDFSSIWAVLDANTPRISFNPDRTSMSYSDNVTNVIRGMINGSIPNWGFAIDTFNTQATDRYDTYWNLDASGIFLTRVGVWGNDAPISSKLPRLIIETY